MTQLKYLSGVALFLLPMPALAADATGAVDAPPVGNSRTEADDQPKAAATAGGHDIIVTGRRLDAARDSIAPALGASDYSFNRATLDKQPGGANTSLSEVLLQAPGVTQDSYGAVHVRNEHANLQYRLNGVIVPESISGFGATFDQRIASSIDLLTGTLPAQYGYRTSGVINVEDAVGRIRQRRRYRHLWRQPRAVEPSAIVKGSSGTFNYFVSGSYLTERSWRRKSDQHARPRSTTGRNSIAVSSICPTSFSDTSRISAFGGTSIGYFQIPNVPGQVPSYHGQRPVGLRFGEARPEPARDHPLRRRRLSIFERRAGRPDRAVHPLFADPLHARSGRRGHRLQRLCRRCHACRASRPGYRPTRATSCRVVAHRALRGLFFQNERTRTLVTSNVLPGSFSSASCTTDPNACPDVPFDFTPSSDIPQTIIDRGGRNGQLYGALSAGRMDDQPDADRSISARGSMRSAPIPANSSSARGSTSSGSRPRRRPSISAMRATSPRRRRS